MSHRPTSDFMRGHWTRWVALGFGTGLSPIAPGTVGTLLGFPLFWLLSLGPLWFQLGMLLALFALGVWVCECTAPALGGGDPGAIVWDEVVAFALVLLVAPHSVLGFAGAFLVFRLFDIWKPFPIGWLDARVGGGLGVMLDDLLRRSTPSSCCWE